MIQKGLVKGNEDQNDPFYQYLATYLMQIGEMNKEFSKNIQTKILVPYSDTSRHIDTKTRENLVKISNVNI